MKLTGRFGARQRKNQLRVDTVEKLFWVARDARLSRAKAQCGTNDSLSADKVFFHFARVLD
jgi:hypothetical protein